MVPIERTRARYRILKLQPSLKHMVSHIKNNYLKILATYALISFTLQSAMRYVIIKGNEHNLFEVTRESPVGLHFKKKISVPRTYDLTIVGYSRDPQYYHFSRKDPFTLRLRLIITN